MVKVLKNLISSRGYSGFGYNRFQALLENTRHEKYRLFFIDLENVVLTDYI